MVPKPIPPQRAYLALTRTSRAWIAAPQGAAAAEEEAGAAALEDEAAAVVAGAAAAVVGAAAEVTTGVEVTTTVEVGAGAEVAALVVVGAAEVAEAEVTGAAPPEPLTVKSMQDSSGWVISDSYSHTSQNKNKLTGLVDRTRVPPPLNNASTSSRALAPEVRERDAEVSLVLLERPRNARIVCERDQRRADDRVGRSVDDRDVGSSGVGSADISDDRENLAGGVGLDVGGAHIRELEWQIIRRTVK